jgi:hypothetical protein
MPVALEEIRRLETDLSLKIPEAGAQRSRILKYALNPEFLSDETYNQFQSSGNALSDFIDANAGCLAGLLWARCFYESGNGGNPRVVVGDYLQTATPPTESDKNRFIALLAERWGVSGTDRDVFLLLQECWIVGGGDAQIGHASNIWKALRTILPAVRNLQAREPDCDVDQIIDEVAFASQDSALPSYLQDLIDIRDPDFADSLLACCRLHEDQPWLKKIHSNAVCQRWNQEADVTPQWMLRKNGNICDVILGFKYINVAHNDLVVTSVSNAFEQLKIPATGINSTELSVADLGPMRDLRWQIGSGRRFPLNVLLPDDNIFFRVTPNGCIHHWVNPNGSALLSKVCSLLFLSRTAAPNFSLGGVPVPCNQLYPFHPVKIGDSGTYNLFLLDFTGFSRREPQELLLDGRAILRMGSKPFIEIENPHTDVQLVDRIVPVNIVHGTNVRLFVRNLPQGHTCPELRVRPEGAGVVEIHDDGSFSLNINQEHFGVEIRVGAVRSDQSIDGARIIFLPESNVWPPQGWHWEQEKDTREIRRYAYQFKEVGNLVNAEISLRCAICLRHPVWWFCSGLWEEKTPNEPHPCAESHSRLDDLSLTVCSPSDASLYLNDNVLRDIRGGEPLSLQLGTAVKPEIEITVEAITESRIDHLSLSSGGKMWALLEIVCVPDRPVVRILAETPHVYLPDEPLFSPESLAFFLLKESDLLDPQWNRELHPLDGNFQKGSFFPINHVQRKPNEGCWLIISPRIESHRSWIEFVLWLGTCSELACCKIYDEETHQPFNSLVADWSNREQPDASAKVQLKGLLDLLSTTRCVQQGIFKRAVESKEYLPYESSSEAWTNYFRMHCTESNSLPSMFGSMLSSGFNWIAHQRWMSGAYKTFRDEFKRAGRKWNKGAKERLLQYAPLLPTQHAIEEGFPTANPDNFRFDRYLDPSLLNIQDPHAVRIHTVCRNAAAPDAYDTGIGWHGFGKEQRRGEEVYFLKLHGGRKLVLESFSYHGPIQFSKPDHRTCRIRMAICSELAASRYFAASDQMAEDSRTIFDNCLEQDALERIYQDVLSLSGAVLGEDSDGLRVMLQICGDTYRDLALKESGQTNRAAIFQLAVICRLHAWHGWREGDQYPSGWPLSDQLNYGLVCVLLARCWQRVDTCRTTLIKDLVPIEWLIAWFHQD